jgi:hypothetical protein
MFDPFLLVFHVLDQEPGLLSYNTIYRTPSDLQYLMLCQILLKPMHPLP